MKRYPTIILRLAIFVAGAIVLAICGGAAWLVVDEEPSSDYFVLACVLLAGTCLAAIPCFIALYQSYRLLGYIDTDRVFSQLSVKALKMIRRSALAEFFICMFGGLPFFYKAAKIEDAPGLVVVGMAIAGAAFVMFVFASVLDRLLQDAIAMKTENELTI